MQWIGLVFGFLSGGALGSYVSCLAWRVPRGESLLPGSACPICKTEIPLNRNVPLLSWLQFHKASPCCGEPIATRYFLFELVMASLCGALGFILGFWAPLSLLVAALILGGIIELFQILRRKFSKRRNKLSGKDRGLGNGGS
jgi:prepilin signal peptidase PulO-like enzyme (type II secretory pathway)